MYYEGYEADYFDAQADLYEKQYFYGWWEDIEDESEDACGDE